MMQMMQRMQEVSSSADGAGGVSPSAEGARGSAPGPRNLFEKRLIKNFSQKSFFICFGAVPLSVVGLLFFVSFYDGRKRLPIAAGGHYPICSIKIVEDGEDVQCTPLQIEF